MPYPKITVVQNVVLSVDPILDANALHVCKTRLVFFPQLTGEAEPLLHPVPPNVHIMKVYRAGQPHPLSAPLHFKPVIVGDSESRDRGWVVGFTLTIISQINLVTVG